MKYIIKKLSLALVHAMMVMTFILAPIPFSENSNVYATDSESQASDGDVNSDVSAEEGCDEGSDDDKGNKQYKAGCEFNDDLATTDLKSHYPDGIKGIIEQFAGAAFALIGVSLISNPIPNAMVECPQQLGAKVTFPIIQASSLAYLIGEVTANLKFKEASKIAVDKTFQAKQDESYDRKAKNKEDREESREKSKKSKEKNNKQLAAYDTLESIYNKQVEGLDSKVKFATAAEIGIITAEVFEVADYLAVTAEGTALLEAALANSKLSLAKLNAMAAPLATQEAAAAAACTTGTTCTVALACGKAILDLAKYIGILEMWDEAKLAEAEALKGKKVAESEAQASGLTGSMAAIGACAVTGGCVPVEGIAEAELSADTAIATTIDGMTLTAKTNRAPFIAELEVSAAGCIGAGSAVMPLVTANEAFRAAPIVCSGTQTVKGADWDTPLPLYSYSMEKQDENTLLKTISNYNQIKTSEKLKYVKVVLHNMFERITSLKIEERKIQDPEEKISKIAANSKFVDFLVEESMDKIQETNFNLEYDKIRKKYIGKELALISDFKNLVDDFKIQMIEAAEANAFKELLNIGVKVVLLYFVMNSWLRNNAFPKPKNRAITWAIMAVINGAIISFDLKSKSEAEERRDRVKEEKQKFLESHAIKTKHSQQNKVRDGEGAKVTLADSSNQNGGGNEIVACAVPKGDGFAPAVCPTVVPRSRFNINPRNSKFSSSGSVLGKALKGISDVGYGAATGQQFSNPGLMEANLGSLSSERDNLIKLRSKLRGEVEKVEGRNNVNERKNGKASLNHISSKFKSLYTGNPNKTGLSESQLSKGSNLIIPKIEKLKKKAKKTAVTPLNIPKFDIPTTPKNDFDFDLGGGDTDTIIEDAEAVGKSGKAEEDLSEFVVNAGEINEDENKNIFKLISNRYLMSYPRLLNEKSKSKEQKK